MVIDEPPLWRKIGIVAIAVIVALTVVFVPHRSMSSKTVSNKIDLQKLISFEKKQTQIVFLVGESQYDKEQREARELKQKQEEEAKKKLGSPGLLFDDGVKIIGDSTEQCVEYYQRVTGAGQLGYAGNIKSEGNEPRVGAGALEARYGHISLVVAIEGDYLILHDANWVKGKITERKVLASSQRGFIY